MNRSRRSLVIALALAPLATRAEERYQYTELKPPLPVDAAGKIEAREFFSYDCIHCYNFEPYIEKWEAKLPKDVLFHRVPATFQGTWPLYAAAFYTFDALGILPKMHRPFFEARHRDHVMFEPGKPVEQQQAVIEWVRRQGLDAKRFVDTMKSFGVQTRVRRATQELAAYKIEGTPTMAVHGRYTISTEEGRTQEGMLDTVSYLIDRLRKRK